MSSKPLIKTYYLPSTRLIPNSPHFLIHYPSLLTPLLNNASPSTAIFDLFTSNAWPPQWLARYGPTQPSHYHSTTHEAMAVISGGHAKILFGVADAPTTDDPTAQEQGGVLLDAAPGDVFIVPAGVAHKTHATSPVTNGLVFYEPDEGGDEVGRRRFFGDVPLEGEFMMMGAYPGGAEWDFKVGGEGLEEFERIWGVPVPEQDPVLGLSEEGLRGLWGKDKGVV